MNPDRYHLTLASSGRTVMHGWWRSEETAGAKFTEWVGSKVEDARVTLVDEETGEVIHRWPDEE